MPLTNAWSIITQKASASFRLSDGLGYIEDCLSAFTDI